MALDFLGAIIACTAGAAGVLCFAVKDLSSGDGHEDGRGD